MTKTKASKSYNPQYAFLNVLQNNNLVANVNCAWAMDFTILNCKLKNEPNSKHVFFVVIDLCARKCIYNRVFCISGGKRTIKSIHVVNALEYLIEERNVEAAVKQNKCLLLVHSDNEPEFTSKKYYDFVKKHPLLTGSTSRPGIPTDNCVVERWNRHFKQEAYKDQ